MDQDCRGDPLERSTLWMGCEQMLSANVKFSTVEEARLAAHSFYLGALFVLEASKVIIQLGHTREAAEGLVGQLQAEAVRFLWPAPQQTKNHV